MLYVFPDYYKSFNCIASRCRHSCCIGWEIDIDDAALARFDSFGGELGKKLRDNISRDGTPHFILGENERCPFLNENNLCELILSCGEDMLCNICTDHPRFRNFFPNRTETGLGLCCEEAARLILDSEKPMALVYEGECESGDDYADAIIALRDELIDMAGSSELTYTERVQAILSRCRTVFPEKTPRKWAKLFLSLERMDKEWTSLLEGLRKSSIQSFEYDSRSGNLLIYFLYRHLSGAYDDGNIQGRVLFAVLSVYMINLLCAVHGSDRIYDIARLYSAEIEYSDENADALMSGSFI